MKRTLIAAVAAVALVAGGGLWVATGSAASAGDSGLRGWPGSKASAAGEVSAAAEKAGGRHTLVIYTRELRGAGVDVGRRGESPGDYFVFEEAAYNRSGKRIGADSVRCMLMVRTFRCDGTIRIWGTGKIDVSGSFFWERDNRIPITGGTGRYAGAGGTLRVFDEPGGRSRLEFHFTG